MDVNQVNTSELSKLLARIDRLEGLDEIRQLVIKYALCLDQRDYDSLVNLFIEDIGVPGKLRGRNALKKWYITTARNGRTKSTAHVTANHIIEFEAEDQATGLVYSRNELETDECWMVEMMIYLDRYTRRDGRWFFQRRTPVFLYQCPMNDIPLDSFKLRWGDHPPIEQNFHSGFPSWDEFWSSGEEIDDRPVPPLSPIGEFLKTLRRGQDAPKVKPAGTMRKQEG